MPRLLTFARNCYPLYMHHTIPIIAITARAVSMYMSLLIFFTIFLLFSMYFNIFFNSFFSLFVIVILLFDMILYACLFKINGNFYHAIRIFLLTRHAIRGIIISETREERFKEEIKNEKNY